MIEKFPFGTHLKSILQKSARYRQFKYSERGLWLWQQFARTQKAIIEHEARYFQELLLPLRSCEAPIFDVGANMGWVSKAFLKFTKKLVAVEPDAFCQNILANRFGKHRHFLLVPKAISDIEGVKEFLIQEEGSALNTFSEKWRNELEANFFAQPWLFNGKSQTVQTTTLDKLIAEYGLPSLAKIDVEGHELEVFKGLSQPIPLIVFEANLPVFWDETKQIIEILTQLDKTVVFNYSLNFDLMLPEYIRPLELLTILSNAGKCSIDIICRMSNYSIYFKPE